VTFFSTVKAGQIGVPIGVQCGISIGGFIVTVASFVVVFPVSAMVSAIPSLALSHISLCNANFCGLSTGFLVDGKKIFL
jgi:hypothetical protein